MDLKETDILGENVDNHWYYLSKAKAMKRLLGAKNWGGVLDVGAGSGFFSKYLLSHDAADEAWCVDISYATEGDAMEGRKRLHFRRSVETVDVSLVLLMDVLEHVDDDAGLLKLYADKVPRGATFLISVPAFPFLWSQHDVFLEHRRRYTLKQIEGVAEKAGLRLTGGAYYFGAVFPLAATIRLIENMLRDKSAQPRSQLKQHHPLANSMLAGICSAELPFMRFNRLAGLTAFCLAVRD